MRGGEYVLEAIAELFPDAELFTLVRFQDKLSTRLAALKTHTSFLQKFPDAERRYRHFLPLMPRAIESFDLRGFELVISSSHCVAKGIRKDRGALHLSYVHAPMRYMWDRYDEYFGPAKASWPVRLAARAFRTYLQDWDRRVSQADRVDAMIANSRFIAEQIKDHYGRDARVIYPFADLKRFSLPRNGSDPLLSRSYLMVGAFAPYKRVDIAIEAFNRLRLPLLIVGTGQEERRLRALASPTIQFLGAISNDEITRLYSSCRAFIFPGKEDFGITPLEAMASGLPVIAFAAGGASESVTEKSGVFFREQTPESLIEAVNAFENGAKRVEEADCRARAAEFSKARFQAEFMKEVHSLLAGKRAKDFSGDQDDGRN